jgi:hypothetical protein
MALTLLHTDEREAIGYFHECHSPKTDEMLDEWIDRMLDKLGPDDCKFLIRNVMPHMKGLWMTTGSYLYVPKISEAYRWSWGETAVKCSNHSKLEGVRIINEKEAVDYKGNVFKMEPYAPILPQVYEDEDLDQCVGQEPDLDRMQQRAVAAAEAEGMPPIEEFGDDGGILSDRPIYPFGLG